MKEISQIRKLSIWIFFVPLIAINLCLFLSINYELLENTIFRVDQIGRSNFTIPYVDGAVSISRVSRTFPAYLIFKPAMIITGILLIFYWSNNNRLVNSLKNTNNLNFKFKTFGILSALFLILHSILLGVKFDIQVYKLFRRIVLLSFIIFEIIAQGILVYNFYKMKDKISNLINGKILKIKIILVFLLAVVAILSLPILVTSGNVHFKHGLEWNYFVGVIIFYFLTRLMWKETT